MRRLLTVFAILLAVLLPSAPAWAHSELAESVPAAGATLASAPQQVRLCFQQKLNPDFTTIVVSDAAKRRVSTSAPAVDGAIGAIAFVHALPNGTYPVARPAPAGDVGGGVRRRAYPDPSSSGSPGSASCWPGSPRSSTCAVAGTLRPTPATSERRFISIWMVMASRGGGRRVPPHAV